MSEFCRSLLRGFGITAESYEGKRLLSCIGCIVILQNRYFCIVTKDGTVKYPYRTRYKEWSIDFCMDGMLLCRNIDTYEHISGTEDEVRHLIGYYSDQNNMKTSVWKNQIVTDCVQKKVSEILNQNTGNAADCRVVFPVIEEDNCHTLSGIGMLCFMQYDNQTVGGYTCSRFTVSGARVEANR